MAESGLVIQQVQGVTIAEIQTSSLMEGRAIEAIAKELYALVDEQDTKKLVVDFRTVGFLASQAIGILVNLHKKSKAIGGELVLCGLRKNLMKVFKITNLHKILTFADDESKALRKFDVFM